MTVARAVARAVASPVARALDSGLSGSLSPLLDGQSGITNAYSLRKLLSSYSGSAIRVERDSDSTQQDIGFTASGDLDTASLLSFVGAGNGYVRTWYDQAGSDDLPSTTTNAQIVSSGSLITDGGRPSMQSSFVAFNMAALPINFTSVLMATESNVPTTSNAGEFLRIAKNGVGSGFILRRDGTGGILLYNHTGVAARTLFSQGAWRKTTDINSLFLYKNFTSIGGKQEVYAGEDKVLDFSGDSRISAAFSQNNYIGNVREIVFFSEDKRSELATLNANIESYYGGAIPANLLTNGGFNTDASGWTNRAGYGTVTVTDGVCNFQCNTPVSYLYQAISTEIGETYRVIAGVSAVGSGFMGVRKSDTTTASSNVVEIRSGTPPTVGTGDVSFVATATTTYIVIQVDLAAQSISVDNIYCYKTS